MSGQANSFECGCYLVTKGTSRFGPLILIDTDLFRFPWGEKARLTLHESKVLFIYSVCVLEQNPVLPNLKLHLEYFGSIWPKRAGRALCSCHKNDLFFWNRFWVRMPWIKLTECPTGSVTLFLCSVDGDWAWWCGSVLEAGPWLFLPPPVHHTASKTLLKLSLGWENMIGAGPQRWYLLSGFGFVGEQAAQCGGLWGPSLVHVRPYSSLVVWPWASW